MKPSSSRLFALDIFRGLTIIFMIMVNSPNTYGQFSHAYWDGVMFADVVFPFFIIIVGVAISLGLKNFKPGIDDPATIMKKVLKRSIIMFLLGMAVNLIYLHFSDIRVLGVLQRIAIVYLVCSFLCLYCSTSQLVKLSIFILLSYWLFILFVPAPGMEAGQLLRGKNIVNWFDMAYLPGMLWRGDWDPEGVLSTYPAIVTGVIGVLMGKIILRKQQDLPYLVMSLFVFGFACALLGGMWSLWFLPIKQIWSSSFVLITGGIASMSLAFLMWCTDIKQYRRFTYVAQVFGANAITAYVLHIIFEKLLDLKIHGLSVLGAYETLTHSLGISPFFSSALWIAMFLCLCFVPVWVLYKKQIFIKI